MSDKIEITEDEPPFIQITVKSLRHEYTYYRIYDKKDKEPIQKVVNLLWSEDDVVELQFIPCTIQNKKAYSFRTGEEIEK